jgi:hypothetical protein
MVAASLLLFPGVAAFAAGPATTSPTPAAVAPEPAIAPAPASGREQGAPVQQPPTFQPGLWEYRRTVIRGDSANPQVTPVTKCTDPTADIRQKAEQVTSKNCQFTPLRHNNDRYQSSWTCPTPQGPLHFRDVLIANDATSYESASEVRSSRQVTQQRIEARRLAGCTA